MIIIFLSNRNSISNSLERIAYSNYFVQHSNKRNLQALIVVTEGTGADRSAGEGVVVIERRRKSIKSTDVKSSVII